MGRTFSSSSMAEAGSGKRTLAALLTTTALSTAALVAGAAVMLPTAAMAQTTWDGSAGTDWADDDNWDNGTPGVLDTAIIPGGVPSNPTLQTVESIGALSITNGTLGVVSGAALDVSGNLIVGDGATGTLNFSGGSINRSLTAGAVYIGNGLAGVREYLPNQVRQDLDVSTSGNLRNDSAELGMERKLRAHQVGKDDTLAACIAPHQGGGRLIAARLDAEDDEVAWVWGSSHDASLQGKTGTIEEYDAFLSI